MKKVITIVVFVIGAIYSHAQTISADSVSAYEGKVVTVCEKVVDTHVSSGDSKVIYLNFGHPYPAQSFTGVIFQGDAQHFSYDPAEYLKGKTMCVTGKVKIYKGRPEIIINRPDQLKIQE